MSSMSMPMKPQMVPDQAQTIPPGFGRGQWTNIVADALMRGEDLQPVDDTPM